MGPAAPGAPGDRDGEAGVATTEWALVTPVLLFLVMLVVQFALVFFAGLTADAAADEGLEAAQAERGSATAGEAAAEAFLAGDAVLEGAAVTVAGGVEEVQVRVAGSVSSLVPGMDFTVSRTAAGPRERFVPDGP